MALTGEDVGNIVGPFYQSPTDETDEDIVPCIDALDEFARTFKSVIGGGSLHVILCRYMDSNESSHEVEDYRLGISMGMIEGSQEIHLDLPEETFDWENAVMWTQPGLTALCLNKGEILVTRIPRRYGQFSLRKRQTWRV